MGDVADFDYCVDLTDYLFTRLCQLGVRSMHGVPGDYNLIAFDYIEPAGIRWVGNANELNAGYAADGYARIKGISALFTVFGVGELSALNAVAGAFAEKAPVVHIVGVPSTSSQQAHLNLHHSLGDGNFRRFAEIYKHFTCAQAHLSYENIHMATQIIDDTLQQCLQQSRPVYIGLPSDLIKAQVPAAGLREHIDTSLPASEDLAVENLVVRHLLQQIYQSKKPLIVVDGFTSRYGVGEEADELVRATGFPTYTTQVGKGIINETYSNFHGIYQGSAGKSKHNMAVDSDLVILVAPLKTDVNTSFFLTLTDPATTIELDRTSITIFGELYSHVNVKHVLRKVLDHLETAKLSQWDPYPDAKDARQKRDELPDPSAHAVIDQDSFWVRVSKFFQPGDVILTETGTSSSGGLDFVLPPDTTMINSSAWLSIGYTLGASVGVALAQEDILEEGAHPQTRRTILFEGDGSFQMTAQSISDIIRNRLNVIIFVINNDGYTIERCIHGMDADYNSIQPWKYLDSASYFGAPEDDPSYPVFTKRASNWGEMLAILDEPQLKSGKGFNMVEVMMLKDDATAALKQLVALAKQRNAGGKQQQQ